MFSRSPSKNVGTYCFVFCPLLSVFVFLFDYNCDWTYEISWRTYKLNLEILMRSTFHFFLLWLFFLFLGFHYYVCCLMLMIIVM